MGDVVLEEMISVRLYIQDPESADLVSDYCRFDSARRTSRVITLQRISCLRLVFLRGLPFRL
jgi:hypothetical protein